MSPSIPLGRRLAYAARLPLLSLLSLALLELLAFLARPLYRPPDSGALDPEARELARIQLERDEIGRLPSSIRFNLVDNSLTEPHPRLMFHVRPNPTGHAIPLYTRINAQGYRGAEFSGDSGGRAAIRVMILGDSCAFGWMIPDYEETFQARLEQKLRALTERYEVYNFAQPGYSSSQGRVLFEEWFPRVAPDLVIVYFGWNDIRARTFLTDDQYLAALRYLHHPLIRLLRRTNIYSALDALFDRVRQPLSVRYAPAGDDNRRVPIADSVANFEAFAQAVERRGGRLLVIPPPHAGPNVQAIYQERIAEQNEAVARALAGRAAFLLLERMRAASPDAQFYFAFDGYHPNPKGAEYIAGELFRAIRDGA